jgi:alpha-L-fucosidase
VGNEQGYAGETNWSTYSPVGPDGGAPAPGHTRYLEGTEGHRDGAAWIPAECDVSIRPGWFYHAAEDPLVKIPLDLMQLYLRSVGRNAALLLNVPLDRRGLVASPDSAALMGFRWMLAECYERSSEIALHPEPGIDSVWTSAFDQPSGFNGVELSEDIRFGQRVGEFRVEAWADGVWTTVASGTTIGRKRIILVPSRMAAQIRVVVGRSFGTSHLRPMRLLRIPYDLHDLLVVEP